MYRLAGCGHPWPAHAGDLAITEVLRSILPQDLAAMGVPSFDHFCVRDPRRIAATCGRRGSMPGELADGGPAVTVVVRCDPVVRGPDVAPMWP
jgi:hypothetical protein